MRISEDQCSFHSQERQAERLTAERPSAGWRNQQNMFLPSIFLARPAPPLGNRGVVSLRGHRDVSPVRPVTSVAGSAAAGQPVHPHLRGGLVSFILLPSPAAHLLADACGIFDIFVKIGTDVVCCARR